MNVVIAIDSFKGSLSSIKAGNAVREGIKRVYPDADISISPVADGGEGTVSALTNGMGGEIQTVTASDPLGRRITCEYGIVGDTAIIEIAAAAGITLLKKEELNPLFATTYGAGELIKDAISKGCRSFIVGIGGSATNDGGTGMLTALGFEFLDKDGIQVQRGAIGVKDICSVKTDNVVPELSECVFEVACDVTNTLCGEQGASRIFAPQKGADSKMVEDMDLWLSRYAETVKRYYPDSDMNYSGAGAAGGLGFAFMTFLNAKLTNGIELVMKRTGLENLVKSADVVITGEGRLDGQSIMGKVPSGVAKIAKKYGKTVFAFAGAVSDDAKICNKNGIDAFFPIVKRPCTLQEAMDEENAYINLADTVEQVFRVFKNN